MRMEYATLKALIPYLRMWGHVSKLNVHERTRLRVVGACPPSSLIPLLPLSSALSLSLSLPLLLFLSVCLSVCLSLSLSPFSLYLHISPSLSSSLSRFISFSLLSLSSPSFLSLSLYPHSFLAPLSHSHSLAPSLFYSLRYNTSHRTEWRGTGVHKLTLISNDYGTIRLQHNEESILHVRRAVKTVRL